MAPRPVAEASILQAKACGVGRAAQGALWSAAKCKFTSHARKQITRGLPGLIPARQAEGWGLRPRSPDVTPPYHQSHAPEAGGRRCTCHHTCSTRGPYGEPDGCDHLREPEPHVEAARAHGGQSGAAWGRAEGQGSGRPPHVTRHGWTRLAAPSPRWPWRLPGRVCYASDPRIPAWGQTEPGWWGTGGEWHQRAEGTPGPGCRLSL